VTDTYILSAYRVLAQREGVFVEPASAASIAGLLKLARKKYFTKNSRGPVRIVCVLTGHGLKDPDRAIQTIPKPKIIPPKMESVLKAL
jgi:threonine synthase